MLAGMRPRRQTRAPLLLAAALALVVLSGPLPRDGAPATSAGVPTSPGAPTSAAEQERDRGLPRPGTMQAPIAPPGAPPADAPIAPGPAPPDVLEIRYRIELLSADPALADAVAVIPAILEDPRGWQQADIDFVLDPSAAFAVVLAEGPDAQELCRPYDVGGQFSCQNGPLVVLNAIRWREGVDHWPGDVESYRTMLVNHEVGHLIGMHHLGCGGDGQVAPVMVQQSGSLRGCEANPWPTTVELRLAATHQFMIAPAPLDVPYTP